MRHEPMNGYLFIELLEDTQDGEFRITSPSDLTKPREAIIRAPGDSGFAPGLMVLIRGGSFEPMKSGVWEGHIIHRDAILASVKTT